MMSLRSTRAKLVKKRGQRGYVMLVILLMLALLTLAIVRAAPAVAVDIQRQQEEELIHRGDQYARAIRRFYRKFNRYPNTLEELKQTNNLRFLRREYKDPITGGDFKLLHAMDIKFQPKGFFGKSASGTGTASGGGLFGSNNSSSQAPGTTASPFGLTPATTVGTGQPQGTDASQPGAQSKPADQTAQKSDSNGFNPGQVFGGGPIVGVSSTSERTSIIELDGKNHYNDWQFFYVPQMDQGQMFPPGNTGRNNSNTGRNNK